jgi:anti-sigma-K factor RskA
MTCDELRPDYALFAMGVLEEPERAEMRTHLERGCDSCRAGMEEARMLVYGLGASAEGPEPPDRLRKRVLALTGAEQNRGWSWLVVWQAATAATLLALLITGYVVEQRRAEADSLRSELARLQAESGRERSDAAELRAAIAMLQTPETREVTFGSGKPAPPRGRVFVNPSSGVLLIASNLPVPPSGKIYEMWIIPKSGKPAPAGLFAPSQDMTAIHVYNAPVSLSVAGIIAVTLEPAGGVDAPTSQPVIAAVL